MAYRKKTLRRMSPEARKYARMIAELESISRRLKNYLATIQDLELMARAEAKREKWQRQQKEVSLDRGPLE